MDHLDLTASLEDYLETILELTREHSVARVRDIAADRDVKPGSVSPAMKRLEAMGLIRYERNDYITLTERGQREARRVLARHHVLTRFFAEVLKMETEAAESEACAMEHHLTDEAMDRFVRFFEFIESCPDAPRNFLTRFHNCCMSEDRSQATCGREYCNHPEALTVAGRADTLSTTDLQPGQSGTVVQINASPMIRRRLLDMGILPNVEIQMERTTLTGDPVWLRVQDYQVSLRREEASGVMVRI